MGERPFVHAAIGKHGSIHTPGMGDGETTWTSASSRISTIRPF